MSVNVMWSLFQTQVLQQMKHHFEYSVVFGNGAGGNIAKSEF